MPLLPTIKFRSRAWKRPSLLAVALLATMIGGCAQSLAPAPLAVQIPDDCDSVLEPVPFPPVVKREDLGVRAGKFAAALGQANHRIEEGRACHQLLRESFRTTPAGRRQ